MCTSDFRCLLQRINSRFVQTGLVRLHTVPPHRHIHSDKGIHHSTSEQCHPSMDLDIPEYSLTLSSPKLYLDSPYSFGSSKGFFHSKQQVCPNGCPASWSENARMSLGLELLLFVSRGSCSSGILANPPPPPHMGGFVLLRLPTQEKAYFCFSRNPHKLIFNKPKITSCCLAFFLMQWTGCKETGLLCIIVILHIFELNPVVLHN